MTEQSTVRHAQRVLVDLSLSVSNGMPGHRSFPPVVIVPYATMEPEAANEDGDEIQWGVTFISTVDHVGTHVDAPLHVSPDGASIDELPLSRFCGPAVCFDLRQIPDLGEITDSDMEVAEAKSGLKVDGHIVLLCTGFHERNWPQNPDVFSDDAATAEASRKAMNSNPGLTTAATHWLADRGSLAHGVEGPSTDIPGDSGYPSHKVCRERGLIHYEWLLNLDCLLGAGEFWFSGFPIKWTRGTGSPVRAVAELRADQANWA